MVDVIGRNDVTARYVITMADVSNKSDCIIKNPHSEMKGLQEKESIMGVRDRYINPSLEIAVWHHSASLVMPDSDYWNGFFYLSLTPMIYTIYPYELFSAWPEF